MHMWERGLLYLRKAGTIILAASIVIWFLLTFPTLPTHQQEAPRTTSTVTEQTTVPGSEIAKPEIRTELPQQGPLAGEEPLIKHRARLIHSYAGRIGRALEPGLRLAGFDWKIGIALISGIAAKEVIISTMGIVYGVEEITPQQTATGKRPHLREIVAGDPSYSPAMALAMMMFVMIYMPCIATLAIVKKELGSWKWSAFLAVYTVVLAYGLAVVIYQGAVLFGLGV